MVRSRRLMLNLGGNYTNIVFRLVKMLRVMERDAILVVLQNQQLRYAVRSDKVLLMESVNNEYEKSQEKFGDHA